MPRTAYDFLAFCAQQEHRYAVDQLKARINEVKEKRETIRAEHDVLQAKIEQLEHKIQELEEIPRYQRMEELDSYKDLINIESRKQASLMENDLSSQSFFDEDEKHSLFEMSSEFASDFCSDEIDINNEKGNDKKDGLMQLIDSNDYLHEQIPQKDKFSIRYEASMSLLNEQEAIYSREWERLKKHKHYKILRTAFIIRQYTPPYSFGVLEYIRPDGISEEYAMKEFCNQIFSLLTNLPSRSDLISDFAFAFMREFQKRFGKDIFPLFEAHVFKLLPVLCFCPILDKVFTSSNDKIMFADKCAAFTNAYLKVLYAQNRIVEYLCDFFVHYPISETVSNSNTDSDNRDGVLLCVSKVFVTVSQFASERSLLKTRTNNATLRSLMEKNITLLHPSLKTIVAEIK